MIIISWVIAVVTFTSLLVGVIAMIMIKIDPVPKWKTVGKILIWVIGLIIFRLIIWGIVNGLHDKNGQPSTKAAKPEITTVQPRYEWTWKLPNNQFVHGRNKNADNETEAEIIPRNDGSLWFNIHYEEYGSPETERIRLGKVGDKSWSGDREQDNPRDRSRVDLDEVMPGVYRGVITWPNGMIGRCSLVKK